MSDPASRSQLRTRMLWVMAAVAAIAAVPAVPLVDERLARAAHGNALHDSRLLQAMTEFGESAYWLVPAALVFAVAAWRRWHNLARWAFALVAAVGGSGLAANLFKWMIGRMRPKRLFDTTLPAGDGRFGFDPFTAGYDFASMPSGHATTCGAASMLLALALPRWRWPLLAMGLVLAGTRVAIHAHYLGDVLAGLALGYACALLTLRLWRARWPSSEPVPGQWR